MKTSETKDTFSDIDAKTIEPPPVQGSTGVYPITINLSETERKDLEVRNPLKADTVIKYLWHYNSNAYIINYNNIGIVSSLDALKQALNKLKENANIQESNILIFLVDQLTHYFSAKVTNQHYTALIVRCDETNNIQWDYIDPLGHKIRKGMADAIRTTYDNKVKITSYKGKIQYVIEQEGMYVGNTYDNGIFLIFLVTQLLQGKGLYDIEKWYNDNKEYYSLEEPEIKVKLSKYLGKAIRKTLLLEEGKDNPDINRLLSVTDIPTIFNAADPKHLYDLLKIGAKVDVQNEYGQDIYYCLSLDQINIIRNYTLRLQSTIKLLNTSEKNLETELETDILKNPDISLLKAKIELLKKKNFETEAIRKVNNTEYYKGWYSNVHDILDQIRTNYTESYKAYKKEQIGLWLTNRIAELIRDTFNQDHDTAHIMDGIQWAFRNKEKMISVFVDDDSKDSKSDDIPQDFIEALGTPNLEDYLQMWVKDRIYEYISNLEQEYDNLYTKLSHDLNSLAHPIAWGIPEAIRTVNGFQDSFVYQGSTIEKTVYIPFTAIHKKLTESNWIMRAGIDNTKNYLLAHIGFIVSDKPHNPEQCFYSGGRVHIDFPIVADFAIFKAIKETGRNYQVIAKEWEFFNNIGKYIYKKQGHHSEVALVDFLKENIPNLVTTLKYKLTYYYGNYENHKVYAITLFVNSQKNICGGKNDHSNCEGKLSNLMRSHDPDSFLGQLKQQLNDNKLKTLTANNEKFPYMFISVSAHEYYESHCYDTLKQDAKDALFSRSQVEQYRHLNIDIKQLAGKIILSSAEIWLDDQTNEERHNKVVKELEDTTIKIPFYTGFRSASGDDNILSNHEEKLEYDYPVCFDEVVLSGI
ncbi:MAG: hypothetical protein LF888_06835 (plasmid) [Candidatus Megaira endosymbiont of Mesostigma viride]|nr:MAG: hypothetical protein LF888_06835 [Candidatus Megaira endosymbiont of Mesostigma viride]HJK89034.1 hypothetical protein [Candidatus Megaira endosymbiont of Mesostigma viride]